MTPELSPTPLGEDRGGGLYVGLGNAVADELGLTLGLGLGDALGDAEGVALGATLGAAVFAFCATLPSLGKSAGALFETGAGITFSSIIPSATAAPAASATGTAAALRTLTGRSPVFWGDRR